MVRRREKVTASVVPTGVNDRIATIADSAQRATVQIADLTGRLGMDADGTRMRFIQVLLCQLDPTARMLRISVGKPMMTCSYAVINGC